MFFSRLVPAGRLFLTCFSHPTVLRCSYLKSSHERFKSPSLSWVLVITNSNTQKSEMYFVGNVNRHLQAIQGFSEVSQAKVMAPGYHLSFLDGLHHKFKCMRFYIFWPQAMNLWPCKNLRQQKSNIMQTAETLQFGLALLWISFLLQKEKKGDSNLYFSISAFRLCSSIKNSFLYFKPSKSMSDGYKQFLEL